MKYTEENPKELDKNRIDTLESFPDHIAIRASNPIGYYTLTYKLVKTDLRERSRCSLD